VSGSTERALEAFELGVVDFVAKPFTTERLAIADDYSSVELANGQRRLHKRTLTELESLLPK
jgi:two-component system response regulator LytT